MQIDVSFLPALAAAFMLVFARVGTMVMLLPGLGEMNVPVRVRLTMALLLAAVLLPLHQSAYQIDLSVVRPAPGHARRGDVHRRGARLAARLTMSSLQVAGSVIAQQTGPRLRHRDRSDPGPAERDRRQFPHACSASTLIFATDLHHLVIAALNDSYTLFAPGRDSAARRRRGADHPHGGRRVPHRHPALGAVPGVRPPVQSRARRAVAADAADAGVLRRHAAVDPGRLAHPAARARRHDDRLSRRGRGRAAPRSRRTRERRRWRDRWPKTTTPNDRKTRPRNGSTRRSSAATWSRARRSTPGS